MTPSYRIRGIEQAAVTDLKSTAAIEITSHRRLLPGIGRDTGAAELEASGDEVVRVELENGLVLWTRADDLIRERGRKTLGRDGYEAWEIDLRPGPRNDRGGIPSERGWLGLGIKVLEFFGLNVKAEVAAKLGAMAEARLLRGNKPGLYRCSLEDNFSLTPFEEKTGKKKTALSSDQGAVLVFIHGTGSSCEGSFGKLWKGTAGAAARKTMKDRYGDRVFALEHRSLTVSPIQNALDLLSRLPRNAEVHLVSHSRGGLVGELLGLGQRDKKDDPLQGALIDNLFKLDRTIAEQLGLSPLDQKAREAHAKAYAADRELLKELLKQLDEKDIRLSRFVRVACPARGTTLASGRLDRWLSVLDFLTGNSWVSDGMDFLLGVVKERTDPRTLPGLEAMMPGSALTRLLQHPALITDADLSVISGDIEGDSLWNQFKLLATDWFYSADHDLVVNTGSMYGGLTRREKGARFLRDQGPEVSHFNYFANDKSIRWLVNGLTRADGYDGGFQPIAAAKHEAPKWREAVRRSRAVVTPLPLAVLLPGIMGSSLQAGDEAVWLKYLALFRGGLGRLRMGKAEVKPTDILDEFYGPLIEFLARSHRVEIFPYDWRLSVRDAAAKLAAKLEVWLPEFERQRQPVHLVAHSMGGLVVRSMIADGGRGTAVWRRIMDLPNSRFMMLGTPNLGSHEAVRWLTGYNPTQAKLSLLDITHGTDDIIDIVNRFPGLLELLPFDPEGPDFSQPSLWSGLKRQLSARWKTADTEAMLQARETWDFLRQTPPDIEHMIYVAGVQHATVVDYRVTEYEEDWLAGRKRLEFIATREGDGTVPWRSGRMDGVPTWYVEDTAHDELCIQKRAFSAYLDLLTDGTTTRLKQTPPRRSRAAAGESERFILPDLPPTDDIPSERHLREFGFGNSRPFDEEAAGRGVPLIQISITHGDLAYAKHPVLVGHYLGDSILFAEKALDDRLKKSLSRQLRLGIYPGPLGTHALFFHDRKNGKPGGALVIGLGQVGGLSPGLLTKGVRDALLDYALRVAQWPDDRFGPATSVRSAAISCLLVGSGVGGMSVHDSVDAILRGAVAANGKLVDAELESRVIIDNIEFLELYEDMAIKAAKAMDSVLSDGELALLVNWDQGTVAEGEGCCSRVVYDDAKGWWHHLEIIQEEHADNLRFIATTDRARAEETLATGQLQLAEGFIRQASRSVRPNPEVAKTLFEMLLPNRLKELAPRQTDLVLLVDKVSARYPWELLEDRWSQGNRPPSVAAGLVRQMKMSLYRPHPAHATEPSAFVVGNPDLENWDLFSDLPGARHEAQRVASLLNSNGYHVVECIDQKAEEILSGLHHKAWRILHLAGHGEHDFPLEEEEKRPKSNPNRKGDEDGVHADAKRVSGMVIGKNTFLTPGDVEQMRWVPELVFINCCHLGKTMGNTAKEGKFSLLAANLAIQFIKMGVKAVVAAGWAVDDGAAEAFAASFYTHMLNGSSFGHAVRAAREEIWVRFPNANTWGAYQCYGEPGFRLHNDDGDVAEGEDRPYHSPAELVAELRNHREYIRMQIHNPDRDAGEAEKLRAGIIDLLKRVPERARDDWFARGDVASALGFAWGENGDYAEAVKSLEKALVAIHGDCPVRALEQCANFRVRLSEQRWRELREKSDAAAAPQRRELIGELHKAILELDLLNQRAPTSERLSLLGSACKRLAWVQVDPAQRLEALVNMANYYRQSYELGSKQGEEDPYPFTNWAVAKVLALRLDAGQDVDWRKTLEDDCRNMSKIARERNEKKPNFWDAVGSADCELVLLLLQVELNPQEANQAALRIAEQYCSAGERGVSPREFASVKEHLDFVVTLERAVDGPLLGALIALRDAL